MYRLIITLMLAGVLTSCTDNNSKNKTTASGELKMLPSPASDSCALPSLFTDKNGLVYLSWVEKKGKESTFKFSTLTNDQWSEPAKISSGNNWFVNWADYPLITSDGNNNMLAHFLEKSDTGKFTYDVKYKVSSDKGITWSEPKILHDDGKQAEHGFVSMVPFGDNYFLSWLDGRNAAMVEGEGHEGHHGEMTIRGAVVSKNGTKAEEWELDKRVCDCCQTSAAITDNGPVVIYRDRSDEEIRDMSIVRLVNGQWTEPQSIFSDNWKITGCPVNGPSADAKGNNLAIAWFTVQNNEGKVKVIFSNDGGASFKEPVSIDEGKPIGRVDLLMLDEKAAMVSWMEGKDIKAVRVNADGTKGQSILIGTSSEARSSGFPQMTRAGDKLLFAWSDAATKTIKVVSISL